MARSKLRLSHTGGIDRRKLLAGASAGAALPFLPGRAQIARGQDEISGDVEIWTRETQDNGIRQPLIAERLAASDDRTARWIGKDAVKELTDPRQIERLKRRD